MTDSSRENLLSDIRVRLERALTAEAEISVFYKETADAQLKAIKPGPSIEEFRASMVRQALLEEMSWTARPVLILDPANDGRLKGLLPDGVEVMMGAPIVTHWGVMGYLCADCRRRHPSFSQAQLKKMGAMAAEAAELWPGKPEESNPSSPGSLPWVATVAIVFLLTAATVGLKPSAAPSNQGPPRANAATQQQSATNVARNFLTALQTRQLSQAYFFLDAAWKQSLTPSEFEQKMTAWLDAEKHSQELSARHIKDEKLAGIKPLVTVYSDLPHEKGSDWTWQLVTENGTYKIAKLEGGPDLGGRVSDLEKTSNP